MFDYNEERTHCIINRWDYDGFEPDYYTFTPVLDEKTCFIHDDPTDPFFRLLGDVSQQRKTNNYRKIGQLLTNRNIDDLSLVELTIALTSLGYRTEGQTRNELIQRLQNHLENAQ